MEDKDLEKLKQSLRDGNYQRLRAGNLGNSIKRPEPSEDIQKNDLEVISTTSNLKDNGSNKYLVIIFISGIIGISIYGYFHYKVFNDASNRNLSEEGAYAFENGSPNQSYAENLNSLDQEFTIVIKSGTRNLNVREEPVNGRVITQVNGDEVYKVVNVRNVDAPTFVLKREMNLVDIETGEVSEKQKNYRFLEVESLENNRFRVKYLNQFGKIRHAEISIYDLQKNFDSWYYLEEKKGWILSTLCDIL